MKRIIEKLNEEKPAHLKNLVHAIEGVKKELERIDIEVGNKARNTIDKREYKKSKELIKISEMIHKKQRKIDEALGYYKK